MTVAPDSIPVRAMLGGGDRRSTGRADEAATMALEGGVEAGALFEAMFDDDSLVRMRAADALEKASARRPELLHPLKEKFLARLPGIRQMEVRWHAAQMLPRLGLTAHERQRVAMPVLLDYLEDKSRIVQTFALQALADIAANDASLRPQVIRLIEAASQHGSPAVKSRGRRLLAKLRPARSGRAGAGLASTFSPPPA